SAGFARAGRAAAGMGTDMGFAAREADRLDRALDRMNHKTVNVSVDVNRTLKGTDKVLADVERLMSGRGGGGGVGAAGGALGGAAPFAGLALPAASALVNPYTLAGAALAAPFAGAALGGGILGVFGAAMTGLGVIAAAKTKPVEAAFSRLAD